MATEQLRIDKQYQDYSAEEILAFQRQFELDQLANKDTSHIPHPVFLAKSHASLRPPFSQLQDTWIFIDYLIAQLDCMEFYDRTGRAPKEGEIEMRSQTLGVEIHIRSEAEKDVGVFNRFGRSRPSYTLELDQSGDLADLQGFRSQRMKSLIIAFPE